MARTKPLKPTSLRPNPLKLNPLQLKTLAVLQQMARSPQHGQPADEPGAVLVSGFPPPHGDHHHVGDAVVLARDATGLHNPAVFAVLERKGLIRSLFPMGAVVLQAGLDFDTGMAGRILHRPDH